MSDDQLPRKPRLALMGEFSAGKSTLSNILLGQSPLPMRVTATRLPPVYISYGTPGATLIGRDGSETPFDLADLDAVDLDRTRMIRLYLESDTLQICDLIDMPGISDPNMDAEVWQSVFSLADSVVWCTHATQAWRQSEAATWEMIRHDTNGDNLLLITQIDKLASERDRARVLHRVRRETEGQFAGIFPVALLQALNAGEDADRWAESGAAQFTECLVEMLLSPTHLAERAYPSDMVFEPCEAEGDDLTPAQDDEATVESAAESTGRVTPKRVRPKAGGERTERLPRRERSVMAAAEPGL
jgi:GTPase SAR1 family protein